MKIAILKPDHLGDLVLSSPAINKILSLNHDVTLIINKNIDFLARFLFPQVKILHVTFAHLSRNSEVDFLEPIFEQVKSSDLLISLRNDPIMKTLIFNRINSSNFWITEDSLDDHESNLQQKCISPVTGEYKPIDFFYTYQKTNKLWPTKISKLGLVISAGFFNNSLPLSRWLEFSEHFIKSFSSKIFIICGPNEYPDAMILQKLIGTAEIIKGGNNIVPFLDSISILDLLVATDSGTAHLCSLSGVPILSLFGASPSTRFRPLGVSNRLVTLNYNCSPCPQFEINKINLCTTKECLTNIRLRNIIDVLPARGK
ncbi:MAG: hypothetical protein B7Y39_10195 [Bdellovibrio sp. 28-41-41]|nr:MAG: hypothetical protein B7Y39_10195 [Bdellovibrio sp. 28-41-41]